MLSKVSALRTGKNKKGFTLVELVIVIAVLAILAAIAIPTVTNVINNANKSANASTAQTVELAVKTTYSEVKAGTDTDSTDVAAALDKNKISIGSDGLPALKGNAKLYYANDNSGKILSSDSPDFSADSYTALASTTPLTTIFGDTTPAEG